MAKNITIPVRLSPEQMAAIHRLAKEHDTTDAQIIRWAIKALLEYIDLHNGKLVMPFDFNELWRIARDVITHADPGHPALQHVSYTAVARGLNEPAPAPGKIRKKGV